MMHVTANSPGLAGKTEYEEHRCNMIVDCVNDMVVAELKLKFASDNEKVCFVCTVIIIR